MDVFREGKFKLLALIEMKLKGEWRGIMVWSKWHHSRRSGIERTREGVAILLNNVWRSDVLALESTGLNLKFSRATV